MAGALALALAAILPASALAAGGSRLGARVLHPGMRGGDVRTLQHDLTQSGFAARATGLYDAATVRAVTRFEHRYHLTGGAAVTRSFVHALERIRSLDVRAIGADSSGGGGLGSTGSGSTGSGSTGTTGSGTTGTTTTGTTSTPTTTTGTTSTTGTTPGTTDGEGTGATMPKLTGPKHVYGSRAIRMGMRGTDVEMMQEYLTLAGYTTSVDGDYGPATRQSVITFQRTGHFRANGIVSHAEAMALRQDVGSTAVAATGTTSTAVATLNANGTATAPAGAPAQVVEAIAAANSIIDDPYIYGGGHGSFTDTGYDCSGAVSFALHGAGLLTTPEDSSQLEDFGAAGPGQWITVYGDPEHAFVVIAGLAFDTAHYGATTPSGSGPRWLQPADATANLSDGGDYIVRHPVGL